MQPHRPTELAFSNLDKSCISVFPMDDKPWIQVNNKKYIWDKQIRLSPDSVVFLPEQKLLFTIGGLGDSGISLGVI